MENKVLEKTASEIVEDKMLKLKKQKNIERYKFYRVFSYDLIFYYAIIYLFLTIEKGFEATQVLQLEAFYILFKFLVQIPSTILINRIGKRKSIIIANFIIVIHLLIMMIATNFEQLLISQLLCAFGYIIKATCESDLLYDSLEHGEKRGSNFAKIDGKATSRYYYMEAISSALSGFLFVFNPYLPMILCLLVTLTSFVISIGFESIHEKKEKKIGLLDEFKEIRYSFKAVLRSKRLVSLLLYNALMIGMIKIIQNLRNTTLIEVGMPEQYFGLIFAALEIISGIASKHQDKVHKKYRNRTLTHLAVPTAISILLLGIILLFNFNDKLEIPFIFILFMVQYVTRGPFLVLIKRYLNNFTDSNKRVKIATVNNVIESIIASCLVFGSSFILKYVPLSFTLIIIGCMSTALFVLLLDKMRFTVGLKMEEYGKKEIL